MSYDVNDCRFSGTISDIREIKTRTGTLMSSFRLQCWRENIRCVCFKEVAEKALTFADGDRVEIKGKVQSSNWQKDDGTKVYSYQVNVSEIGSEGEKPREQQQPQSPARPGPSFAGHEEFDYQGGPF